MANIKFINHSSILIQDNQNFILTDPWYEKPAFGSWLPAPPCSIHPSYLVALSKTVENFILAISHGHDDHLDDSFLSLFPKKTKVLIPKYKSPGLISRLKRNNFTNIFQADESGIVLGGFVFKSYINPKICPDDAIITIEGSENFIIHANDNWQKLEKEVLSKIIKDSKKYTPEEKLYMSQCNIADGWPYIYRDYSESEKTLIHKNRVTNIIVNTLQNATMVDCKYFLNYAGHASIFVDGVPYLKKASSYVSNKTVKKIANLAGSNIDILDMIPGDSFDFKKITNQFSGIFLEDSIIKEASLDFYEKYEKYLKCDTFNKDRESEKDNISKEKIDSFLLGFQTFVAERVYKTDFNSDILDFKVIIKSDKVHSEIKIGPEGVVCDKSVTYYISDNILQKLLSGNIVWENLYIGHQTEVQTFPLKTNIRAPVRWLASYGYVYQRNAKMLLRQQSKEIKI